MYRKKLDDLSRLAINKTLNLLTLYKKQEILNEPDRSLCKPPFRVNPEQISGTVLM